MIKLVSTFSSLDKKISLDLSNKKNLRDFSIEIGRSTVESQLYVSQL